MKNMMWSLPDFPRGQRVIRFGAPVKRVTSVWYSDAVTCDAVAMDPKSYVVYRDRLILGQDVWPRICEFDPWVAINFEWA